MSGTLTGSQIAPRAQRSSPGSSAGSSPRSSRRSSPRWVLGLTVVASFLDCERRARQPMLPLDLFRSRGFSAGNAAVFFWSASMLGALFFMAQLLQTALGYGPLAAGLGLMPWGATAIVVPRVAGGLSVQAACMAWIAMAAEPGLPYWHLVAPLVLSGAGIAVAYLPSRAPPSPPSAHSTSVRRPEP
jgi:hypothetical protein